MKRMILTLVAYTPLPILHAVAHIIGRLLYRLNSRHRYYAETNLELCFPELSTEQRAKICQQSLIGTAKVLLESPKLWLGPKSTLLGLVKEIRGEEILNDAIARQKGVILICPHLGNWEIVGQYVSHLCSLPVTTMYRSQRDKEIDGLMRESRARFGAELVPATQAGIKQLLRALKAGHAIGALPDQNPGRGTGVFVPFFNVLTYTPVFVARLAARTNAVVVNVYSIRLPRYQGFRIVFSPASECLHDSNINTAAACMNRDLEELIRSNPAQYWWSYNRFRTRPEGAEKIYKND